MSDAAESAPEIVDGLPVLHEGGEVVAARPVGPVAVQAAAAAGAGFAAGAVVLALLRGRKGRRSAVRIGRGRRGRRLDVLGSRSFLVDVHVLDRR